MGLHPVRMIRYKDISPLRSGCRHYLV